MAMGLELEDYQVPGPEWLVGRGSAGCGTEGWSGRREIQAGKWRRERGYDGRD